MDRYEEAMKLVAKAWHSTDPRGPLRYAREAVEVCDYCPDAYLLLAGLEPDPSDGRRRLDLLRQALRAGERLLGTGFIQEAKGFLADYPRGRAYLRARAGLASRLAEMGKVEEAVELAQESLVLDPTNREGLLYPLSTWLLLLWRQEELGELFRRFPQDEHPHLRYNKALRAFRTEPDDSPAPLNLLEDAQRQAPLVVEYLLGERESTAGKLLGEEVQERELAMRYALQAWPAWEQTPGALMWLQEHRGVADRELNESICCLAMIRDPSEDDPAAATLKAALEGYLRTRAEEHGLDYQILTSSDGAHILAVRAEAADLEAMVEDISDEGFTSGYVVSVTRDRDAAIFDELGVTVYPVESLEDPEDPPLTFRPS